MPPTLNFLWKSQENNVGINNSTGIPAKFIPMENPDTETSRLRSKRVYKEADPKTPKKPLPKASRATQETPRTHETPREETTNALIGEKEEEVNNPDYYNIDIQIGARHDGEMI